MALLTLTSEALRYGWVVPTEIGDGRHVIAINVSGTLTNGTVVTLWRRLRATHRAANAADVQETVDTFTAADAPLSISLEADPAFEYDLGTASVAGGDAPTVALGIGR